MTMVKRRTENKPRVSSAWSVVVKERSPGAKLQREESGWVVRDTEGTALGVSTSQLGAWHAAFQAVGGTVEEVEAALSRKMDELASLSPPEVIPAPDAFRRSSTTAETVRVAQEGGLSHGAWYPQVNPTFVLDKKLGRLFDYISSSSSPKNIMLVGPHGCGKTETAIQYAARMGKPLLIMDCAHTREGYLWWGRMHVSDGTTYFKPSEFFKAVEEGGYVILLDELNRVDSSVLSPLMPLLDDRRATHVPDTDHILQVGPGTVFFATMNEGNQYTGTSTLDAAIQDRFSFRVEVDYLDRDAEIGVLMARTGVTNEIAVSLVDMANVIRKKAVGFGSSISNTISTRQLISAANLYTTMGIDALDYTIANHFSADGDANSERRQVLQTIQGKFGSGQPEEAF